MTSPKSFCLIVIEDHRVQNAEHGENTQEEVITLVPTDDTFIAIPPRVCCGGGCFSHHVEFIS